ncbi:MAG: trypsin-like peptidase domain-containing protein [Pleurocapsa minor GSE-CHR-MK-17-07R]|nr:trypsin-like peptidase domain-containing protein [Pleurocapsa minor GSE-CHR-MK 17-07R]
MKRTSRTVAVFLAAFALAIGAMIFGSSLTASASVTANFQAPVYAAQAQPTYITDNERLLNSLYSRIAPSVVLINVNVTSSTRGTGQSTGSGFVIDQQGHIVTNNHVVDDATLIEVRFFDGRIARGEIVGLDPDSDLAVIQVSDVPAEALFPLTLGNSGGLYVGQEVIAIGAPFNQAWTMTTGIVSALDRSIQGLTQFSIGSAIQTDAAINPGNSGGPLLNLSGEVIGVNSQIISRTNSSAGVGFAIPSNLVARVAQQLIETGRVQYSYLGISGQEMNLEILDALNLPNTTNGVVVTRVERNSPAAQAGLQNPVTQGNSITSLDIITSVDGIRVSGMPDLISYLASNTVPNQVVTLEVLRNGQSFGLNVQLSERPR